MVRDSAQLKPALNSHETTLRFQLFSAGEMSECELVTLRSSIVPNLKNITRACRNDRVLDRHCLSFSYDRLSQIMLSQGSTPFIGFMDHLRVFKKLREHFEGQGLGPVHQRLSGNGMEIREYHIGACNYALRHRVHHVEYSIRSLVARADGV